MTTRRIPALTRFMAKVDTSAGWGQCWPWTGARDRQGYAVFSIPGVSRWITIPAHRWLMGYLRGRPLGPGEMALHQCDNPPCVNPRHLYVGTGSQNSRDMYDRKRHPKAVQTHCKHGHEFTAETTYVVPSTGHRQCRACQREVWQQPTPEERHRRYVLTGK